MGVDEALLRTAAERGVPSLRLYGWLGPWLSLGYAQQASEAVLEACLEAGTGVVRRVTGGRAVLHGRDLTYAVAAPESLLPAGLRASYELVSEVLTRAMRALGVEAEPAAATPRRPDALPFDCFARPAGGEICVGGRKLAGSAQRRAAGGVLQHGSIRLGPDPEPARAATGLHAAAATSLEELGLVVEADAVRDAFLEAFRHTLGAPWEPSELLPGEREWGDFRAKRHVEDPIAVPIRLRPRPQECPTAADR